MNLSIFDIIVVVAYLILIFFSGTLVKKYVKGIDNFLVAGRSMKFHLGLLSLMCTEIGMITYVYYAELGFKSGFAALIVAFPPVIAYIFLGKTGFIIKPLLEMKLSTIPEFFSRKFSNGVRLYIGIIMAIGGILNFGVFPGVEANFINIVTGIPKDYLLVTMVVMLTVVLFYTAVGGMVSVIVTNYIQYVLLSFGMLFITIYGVFHIGWGNIVTAVTKEYGEKGMNPFSPSIMEGQFGFGFLVWQILLWVALLVGWQAISMRLFSSKDAKTGQKIYTWSGLLFLSRAIMPILWGIMAIAVVGTEIDSLEALPLLLVEIIPSGLLGIIFAALLAASMSTYASYLLSWSSVVSQDIIGSVVTMVTKKELDSKTQLLVSRITMAGVMIFIIWWSLFHEMEGLLYFYLNMTGMLFIPGVLICVAFGIYWKKSRTLGAYLAITFGAILPMLYLIWPTEVQDYASEIGWGGFVVSVIGMLLGSTIQNIFQPKVEAESV
ncbi:MAG: sodium:solute symporter family protein [Melioribacteraceae bacterium]